jgi:hypothetical protein
VTYIEIYKETIRDLLAKRDGDGHGIGSRGGSFKGTSYASYADGLDGGSPRGGGKGGSGSSGGSSVQQPTIHENDRKGIHLLGAEKRTVST